MNAVFKMCLCTTLKQRVRGEDSVQKRFLYGGPLNLVVTTNVKFSNIYYVLNLMARIIVLSNARPLSPNKHSYRDHTCRLNEIQLLTTLTI